MRLFVVALSASLLSACGGGGGGGGNPPVSDGGGDAVEFKVTATAPAAFQNNVYVGTTVSATFSAPVNMGSVSKTTFYVAPAGSLPLNGSYSYDSATYTVTFKPSAPLAYDADYAVIISGVRSSSGATVTNYAGLFSTQSVPDTTPPTTVASPAGDHYKDTVYVTLSCDDAGGTGCAATYYTTNGSTPTKSSTRYSAPIAIDASATLKFFSVDVSNNSEAVQSEAYVIDRVPPVVELVSPLPDSTDVKVTEAITVTFSEAMDPASLGDGIVLVDNGVTGDLAYDALTYTLTFTPHERLACNTLHTATVTTAGKDLARNALEADYSWSFTTVTDCEEPVTTADSSGGVFSTAQAVTLSCTDVGSGCARIVYTTDGSQPSLYPVNGTVVYGASAGPINVGEGETTLRFFAEDHAGNREVLRQLDFSVSTNGFTYAATSSGLSRGVGPIPTRFVNTTANGNTRSFFLDESNGRLYRATNRGLFVSDDQAATWKALPLPRRDGFLLSVNVVFAQGSKLLLGTSYGLYVSVDGGSTFEHRPSEVYDTEWVVGIHASGPRVYVATSGGLRVSEDKGYSFVRRTTVDGLGSNSVRSMLVRDGVVHLGTDGGLSISTDGGQSFTNLTTAHGLGANRVNAVALSPDGSVLYAGTEGGLSISDDGGASFVTRTTAEGLAHNNVARILATDTHLYLGTGVSYYSSTTRPVAVSTNGGASFVSRTLAREPLDVHVNALFQLGDRLLIGAYPAYYESLDNATTFEPKEFPNGEFRKVQYANGRLYATVADSSGFGGIIVSDDGGATFQYRDERHGLGYHRIEDLVVVGNAVYAGSSVGLSISTDAGESFVHRSRYDSQVGLSAGAEVLHVEGSTVLAGFNNGIDRSTNGGETFTNLLKGSSSSMDLDVAGPGIYLATTGGLWISPDNGATFTKRTKEEHGLPDNYLYSVAVSGDTVFVGCLNNGLGISTDGGESFVTSPGFPLGGVQSLELIDGRLYAGTTAGLAVSEDGGQSFVLRTDVHGLGQTSVKHAYYVPAL